VLKSSSNLKKHLKILLGDVFKKEFFLKKDIVELGTCHLAFAKQTSR
jgi:hypothetical protein